MTTRIRPIPPAIRPASSWFLPSWAVTVVVLTTLNVSGRAPYLSWLASWVAAVSPPMLVIWTCPLGMASVVCGASITYPSSTIAVWASTASSALLLALGVYLVAWVLVSSLKALAALELRLRLTTHWLLVVSMLAASLVTS